MRRSVSFYTFCLVIILGSQDLTPTPAQAVPYTFTTIADTAGPFSSLSAHSFGASYPAINDSGTVAFGGVLDNSPGRRGALFTSNGSGLNLVAGSDSRGDFQTGHVGNNFAINNQGAVAYNTGTIAIAQGSTLTVVPAAARVGGNDFFPVSMNNRGEVAFTGTVLPLSADPHFVNADVMTFKDGSFRTIASVGPIIFTNNTFADINNRGQVAFSVRFSANPALASGGIFVGDGSGLLRIANTEGVGASFAINDAGRVAYTTGNAVQLSGPNGATTIANAGSFFSSFFTSGIDPNLGLNNRGEVAFLANLHSGGYGLFTGTGSSVSKVIAVGDNLFGSTVAGLGFYREGLNNGGQLAFFAGLADGRQGIYRAKPLSEPASLLLIISGLVGIGLARFRL